MRSLLYLGYGDVTGHNIHEEGGEIDKEEQFFKRENQGNKKKHKPKAISPKQLPPSPSLLPKENQRTPRSLPVTQAPSPWLFPYLLLLP
jgi:hypothetical protein